MELKELQAQCCLRRNNNERSSGQKMDLMIVTAKIILQSLQNMTLCRISDFLWSSIGDLKVQDASSIKGGREGAECQEVGQVRIAAIDILLPFERDLHLASKEKSANSKPFYYFSGRLY